MKYKDYKILQDGTRQGMELTVKHFLEKGYTLIGGVAVYGSGQNSSQIPYTYTQAVAIEVIDYPVNTGPR